MSCAFRSVQELFLKTLPNFPVPLPSSYVRSIDAVLYFDNLGGGVPGAITGPIYMLGNYSAHGLWYYYFVAIFFKLPIPVLLIWISLFYILLRNITNKIFFRNSIFVLIPALYYLMYMSFFYGTQIGIRHIMIIFPLLYIYSGEVISRMLSAGRQWLLWIFVGWHLLSVLSYFPHFLPYTNEFIFPKKLAYKKISESNLSYGEGLPFLQEYLRKYNDAIVHPDTPVAGKVIVEVGHLTNASIYTLHKYDWLQNIHPIGHVHSQYIIFDVSTRTADSLRNLRKQ